MKKLISILATVILATVMIAFTESKTVTGTVTDQQGQAIPGVIVSGKGSSVSVLTNSSGSYSITINQKVTEITFSFIGYKSVTVKINNRTIINVKMEEDLSSLQEIVVTGYDRANGVPSKSMYSPYYRQLVMNQRDLSGGLIIILIPKVMLRLMKMDLKL